MFTKSEIKIKYQQTTVWLIVIRRRFLLIINASTKLAKNIK